jgi:hypothetical protein
MNDQPLAAVLARSPRDGQPFYCMVCGAGYAEWLACDNAGCVLESRERAKARQEQTNAK